jgi:hypothetical protein
VRGMCRARPADGRWCPRCRGSSPDRRGGCARPRSRRGARAARAHRRPRRLRRRARRRGADRAGEPRARFARTTPHRRTRRGRSSARATRSDRARTFARVQRSSSRTMFTRSARDLPSSKHSRIERGARTKSRRRTPPWRISWTSKGAPGPISGSSRGSSR